MDMFEKASRAKLRFETSQGALMVEDLWSLPLKDTTGRAKANLNDIAKGLNKKLKNGDDVDFVGDSTSTTLKLEQLKFDIVRHVIDTRLSIDKANASRRATAEHAQMIMRIVEEKKLEGLKSKNVEELMADLARIQNQTDTAADDYL